MDDEKLKEIADEIHCEWLDSESSYTMDAIMLALKRGIDLARQHDKQTDQQLESEYRKVRRDRFIAAAISGMLSSRECHAMGWSDDDFAREALKSADAILALLDAEAFERESEKKL